MAEVWLALGSNVGDKRAYLEEALRRLAGFCTVRNVSMFHETAPVGYLDQDWFLNAAAQVETDLEPRSFLACMQEIESALGRERTIENGPRTVDLDILFWDSLVLHDAELTVPHARLHERLFVLEPLCEIAPDLMHPSLGQTVRQLLERLRPNL